MGPLAQGRVRSVLLSPLAVALWLGLVACGGGGSNGDGSTGAGSDDGSAGGPGGPAPASSAPPAPGGGSAGSSEYCDRLLATLENVGAQSSGTDFSELAGQLVEDLRADVLPYAPDALAGDLEAFIEYYDVIATDGMLAVAELDSEQFVSATNAVFGACAAAPVVPPIGS